MTPWLPWTRPARSSDEPPSAGRHPRRPRGLHPRLPLRLSLPGDRSLSTWPRLLTVLDIGARPSPPPGTSGNGQPPAPVGAHSRCRSGPSTDPKPHPWTQPTAGDPGRAVTLWGRGPAPGRNSRRSRARCRRRAERGLSKDLGRPLVRWTTVLPRNTPVGSQVDGDQLGLAEKTVKDSRSSVLSELRVAGVPKPRSTWPATSSTRADRTMVAAASSPRRPGRWLGTFAPPTAGPVPLSGHGLGIYRDGIRKPRTRRWPLWCSSAEPHGRWAFATRSVSGWTGRSCSPRSAPSAGCPPS